MTDHICLLEEKMITQIITDIGQYSTEVIRKNP